MGSVTNTASGTWETCIWKLEKVILKRRTLFLHNRETSYIKINKENDNIITCWYLFVIFRQLFLILECTMSWMIEQEDVLGTSKVLGTSTVLFWFSAWKLKQTYTIARVKKLTRAMTYFESLYIFYYWIKHITQIFRKPLVIHLYIGYIIFSDIFLLFNDSPPIW